MHKLLRALTRKSGPRSQQVLSDYGYRVEAEVGTFIKTITPISWKYYGKTKSFIC